MIGPGGNARNEHATETKGTKYQIKPVRREFLFGFEALIRIDADTDLENRIGQGVEGSLPQPRYGLPFLGDNAFLPDVIDAIDVCPKAYWFSRTVDAEGVPLREGMTRLTVWIDRADMSKTVSHLYVPTEEPTAEPPDDAWTTVGPPASDQ